MPKRNRGYRIPLHRSPIGHSPAFHKNENHCPRHAPRPLPFSARILLPMLSLPAQHCGCPAGLERRRRDSTPHPPQSIVKTFIARALARLAVVLLFLAAAEQAGAQTWTTVNSNPQIAGMFMLNSTTGWAVGSSGGIRSTVDGSHWSRPVFPTNSSLQGVWGADASHVWAVGTTGSIAFWNGNTWSTQTSGTT